MGTKHLNALSTTQLLANSRSVVETAMVIVVMIKYTELNNLFLYNMRPDMNLFLSLIGALSIEIYVGFEWSVGSRSIQYRLC